MAAKPPPARSNIDDFAITKVPYPKTLYALSDVEATDKARPGNVSGFASSSHTESTTIWSPVNMIASSWNVAESNATTYYYYLKEIDGMGNHSSLLNNEGFERGTTGWGGFGSPNGSSLTNTPADTWAGEYGVRVTSTLNTSTNKANWAAAYQGNNHWGLERYYFFQARFKTACGS